MSAIIYLEGGGDNKDLKSRCRKGFAELLQRCGFSGRMPKLVARGSRNAVFDSFEMDHAKQRGTAYVAMLIDSEEPLSDLEAAWQHLNDRDGWSRPDGTSDEQVLFMTTCMETWIVADRATLSQHYKGELQDSALPALNDLESRSRHDVQQKLAHATRNCQNAYAKGRRSFAVLGKLSPSALKEHLPSFRRVARILENEL